MGFGKKYSGLGGRQVQEDWLGDYCTDQNETRNKDCGNKKEKGALRDFETIASVRFASC